MPLVGVAISHDSVAISHDEMAISHDQNAFQPRRTKPLLMTFRTPSLPSKQIRTPTSRPADLPISPSHLPIPKARQKPLRQSQAPIFRFHPPN